uniref:Lipoxygenase domain-containing protein n=1 Tax=Sinocyclocheilus anshuiensis TaxID=1608454 RepID=A0A671S0F8_9TELE
MCNTNQLSLLLLVSFDYDSWFPNAPGSLKRPPPTSKGSSDKNTLLDTLPDMKTSAYLVSVFWLLSKPSLDLVSVSYSTDWIPFFFFRTVLFESINDRNNGLQVPYTYMCPDNISNSVSI